MPSKNQCRLSTRKWTSHNEVIVPQHQNTDHDGQFSTRGSDTARPTAKYRSPAAEAVLGILIHVLLVLAIVFLLGHLFSGREVKQAHTRQHTATPSARRFNSRMHITSQTGPAGGIAVYDIPCLRSWTANERLA